uniref:Uncharacterized protein n=1 Tax=Anguilla anguilla TaxID=7936 RepID=A0A0E9V1E9_ANGAN
MVSYERCVLGVHTMIATVYRTQLVPHKRTACSSV